ncbi:MAG: polysaccharide pyruvyl transferase family protein [Fuerstiella sp.]
MERIPHATVKFAVTNLPGDVEAAADYDCDAIATPGRWLRRRLLIPRSIYQLISRTTGKCSVIGARHSEFKQTCDIWQQSLTEADVVLNLSGIAFVGDGMRRPSIARDELYPFEQSRAAGKPYARFIQSFGPFGDRRVAKLALRELPHLHRIYARGAGTAIACSTLIPTADVRTYPDCAIGLTASGEEWRKRFFSDQRVPLHDAYTVVSPSAVVAGKHTAGNIAVGANYTRAIGQVVERLVAGKRRVLLMPHARYPHHPTACDLEVCRQIFHGLQSDTRADVHLIDAPLTAPMAKQIISSSELAIVSRYHAAIAALSSATPLITIGWNQKYEDIVTMYGLSYVAIDVRDHTMESLVEATFNRIDWWRQDREARVAALAAAHRKNAIELSEAFAYLCSWLESVCGCAVLRAA